MKKSIVNDFFIFFCIVKVSKQTRRFVNYKAIISNSYKAGSCHLIGNNRHPLQPHHLSSSGWPLSDSLVTDFMRSRQTNWPCWHKCDSLGRGHKVKVNKLTWLTWEWFLWFWGHEVKGEWTHLGSEVMRAKVNELTLPTQVIPWMEVMRSRWTNWPGWHEGGSLGADTCYKVTVPIQLWHQDRGLLPLTAFCLQRIPFWRNWYTLQEITSCQMPQQWENRWEERWVAQKSTIKALVHFLTQSWDLIRCCRKPVERTDEIGLETIFLVHSISSKLLYLTTESEGGLGP